MKCLLESTFPLVRGSTEKRPFQINPADAPHNTKTAQKPFILIVPTNAITFAL